MTDLRGEAVFGCIIKTVLAFHSHQSYYQSENRGKEEPGGGTNG
jgi:hypothetical protein